MTGTAYGRRGGSAVRPSPVFLGIVGATGKRRPGRASDAPEITDRLR
ncbi:hypothetical protein [Actinomadura spongiicola]|nr:hypothetical protein [Actinomadura spongiicola]